ncbi:hypothetical protein [uncultured Campylobacter sp.]|uniref:hypothetical protein n=1 Tax=uncultured Campylobacter sp. TaxID=218934 RepID=UPI00262C1B01|nr:hypothetical protein [uncultured Campylobacter sp.]
MFGEKLNLARKTRCALNLSGCFAAKPRNEALFFSPSNLTLWTGERSNLSVKA